MYPMISRLTDKLKSSRLAQGLALLLALVMLTGGYFLIQAVLDPYNCRIVEGVAIDGVEIGGMTRGQARKALKTAAEETILSQPLTVILPEETLILDPKALNLKLDVRQIVKDAYSLGRKTDSLPELNSGLSVYLSYYTKDIFAQLLEYSAEYDMLLTQPSCHLKGDIPPLTENDFDPNIPCPSLTMTLGTPECDLDTGVALHQIAQLYSRGISAVRAGEYTLTIESKPEQLPAEPDIASLSAEFSREAVDAYADLESYEIVPATYGLVFDPEAAQAAVDAAAYGETIIIPMEYQIPEILSDSVPFRDVLGHCETKHTDDENRNTNLRLVCEILDGYILNPGEEFSYNGVIGERTEERGFKAAGAYSGTRLVKDIGGGVCQGSSTLYNCVLLADLEVTERVCHGLLVNYLPIGMDAAVNWATKTDFKFRNNFHFPVMIRAELSDGYMKMQIVGVDEKDYYIEMRSGRSDEEHRIYSNSYKYKYDKETGEQISRELEARSSYMYFS